MAEKAIKLKQNKQKTPFTLGKFRKFMMGTKDDMGFLKKLFTYIILVCVGFIFLYPIFRMISTSFMDLSDLLDSSIQWLPTKMRWSNYKSAISAMNYKKSLIDSIIVAGIPTVCQVVVSALVGYGLARFDFFGKKAVFGLIIFSFVLPPQILVMPTYVMYMDLGWIGTLTSYIVPSILGQGLKSQIFILICWSFFKQVPQSLIEAASIDGAGYLKSFFKVALPSAAGGLLVVFLFSFVWYWNESYLTQLYIYGSNAAQSTFNTIVCNLDKFENSYASYAATSGSSGGTAAPSINDSIRMAATMLSILPLLLMYFVLQRQFVESIDRTGITGE